MTSPRASDLFAAARADAPQASACASMWDRISLTVASSAASAAGSASSSTSAAPPPPAPPPPAAVLAAASSSVGVKLVAIGGAIGVGGTALGVVLALTLTGATTSPRADASGGRTPAKRLPAFVADGARLADPSPRVRASADASPTARAPAVPSSPSSVSSGAALRAKDEGGDLAEEARLVMAARAALVGGEPARALALVHAAQRMPGHALDPEELGVEARALRALGRADEAAAAELTLKLRYPGHALAR